MTQPLAHYFLYTGHNSYLTGNQLSSDSSVEPIIKALGRGVRVIELDLWPGSKQDEVEVRHGGYGVYFHLFQILTLCCNVAYARLIYDVH
jgi:hypothetical protein